MQQALAYRCFSFAQVTPSCAFGWSLEYFAEADTSNPASEACCGGPENIGVMAVVIAELRLGNIEGLALAVDLLIAANDTADSPGLSLEVGGA